MNSGPGTDVVPRPAAPAPVVFDAERVELLRRTIARDLVPAELELFIEYVRRTRLDPFTRQIHAMKVDGNLVIQVGIDGLRLVAERTGQYAGQLGPLWKVKGGPWVDVWEQEDPPHAAKVGILRSDFAAPVWGIAHLASFIQRKRDGSPRVFWRVMPEHMLAKIAEAQALRKAFPAETTGLYVALDEEGRPGPGIRISNPDAKASQAQLGALMQLARQLDWSDEERRRRAGVESFTELDKGAASSLIDEWTGLAAGVSPDGEEPGPGESGSASPGLGPIPAESAEEEPFPGAGAGEADDPQRDATMDEAIRMFGSSSRILATFNRRYSDGYGGRVTTVSEIPTSALGAMLEEAGDE
jgi:phage recombination protein Bet